MSSQSIKRIQLVEKPWGYGVRKPHGIPTTRGNERCFLDLCDQVFSQEEWRLHQKVEFTKEQERGLINRLDNDTAGFVWFVKSSIEKQKYLMSQSQNHVYKVYIALLEGILSSDTHVDIPLMHHRMKDRMICATADQVKYGVGSLIFVETDIRPVLCDHNLNQTRVTIIIKKGARHQIRCHCSYLGYPIVGDVLYGTGSDYLQLYSIDLNISS